MDSVGLCEAAGSPPVSSLGAKAALSYGGSGVAKSEWHSIPLEDASRAKVDCAFHLIQGGANQQEQQQARKLEFSMCGLSTGALPGYTTTDSKKGLTVISMESADPPTGGKEVRLSFGDDFGDSLTDNKSTNMKNNRNNNSRNEAGGGTLLGYGAEGCLPLISQLRAFIKGAKLSCSALSSDGWASLLQRSFSFSRSTDSSSSPEGEMFCKKSSSTLSRTLSAPLATGSGIGSPDALMKTGAGALQGRDPQSRAEALPLAHYRPTEAGALSPVPACASGGGACKSPVNMNCKKPPKPPRHPGRTASLDSATIAAQRAAARKSRDKASARRKSRTATAAASTGVTPLVALVLTIGFGVLMVFQGVFVQTNVSYGRDADRAFVDVAANLRSSLASQQATSDGYPYRRIDPQAAISTSSYDDALDSSISSEAALADPLQKSMEELPWSRSSLQHQIKSSLG